MIVGTGVDVLAVSEMQRELEHGAWTAADGIFRDSELHFCNAARFPARRLAACFAAKEAALKALNVPVTDLKAFHDIEIIALGLGNVRVRFYGRAEEQCCALGVKNILAALHSDRYVAAAMVVLEG